MSFEKYKYEVVRKAISRELASFCYAYFINKRQVAKHLQNTRYLSPYDDTWGTWKDETITYFSFCSRFRPPAPLVLRL